jgi:transglutaminase-like putative cysteine protease
MRVMRFATPGRLLAGSAMLIALVAAVTTLRLLMHEPAGHYPKDRVVYWQLGVENTSSKPLRDIEIHSFAPVRLSWQQKRLSLEANVPLIEADETPGKGAVRANVALIPPFGRRDIRFQATMAMADDHRNAHMQNPNASSYRQASAAEQNAGIAELARQLERATAMETTRSIYDWLVSEIRYSGYDPVERGAIAAFEQREGDCSEFASLGVALAGALGMQARKVNGFVVHEDGRLGPFDFHAWAEIRVDDRWVILDAQERQFDPGPSAYLATSFGSEYRDGQSIKFAANSDAVRIYMEQ